MSKKIIVELVDKHSGFADHVGRVNFSAAKVVQEVVHTKPIQLAIRQGVLMVTTAKRLEEWKQEREDYVAAYVAAKKAANEAGEKASVTLRERFTAQEASLATEKATVNSLKGELKALQDELKALKEPVVKEAKTTKK